MRTLIGTWLQSGSPAIVELLSKLSPFDFLVIDQEHTPSNIETVANMIRCSFPVWVRISHPDFHEARRYADIGADGIIAPMVETVDDAIELVRGCLYPPAGKRGLGFCRSNLYGKTLDSRQEVRPIAQIETAIGFSQREGIATTPGLWGVMIGPYDLSQSLGVPYMSEGLIIAMKEIISTCRAANVRVGWHVVQPDLTQLDKAIEAGANLIAYGTDLEFIRNESDRFSSHQGEQRESSPQEL